MSVVYMYFEADEVLLKLRTYSYALYYRSKWFAVRDS